MTDEEVLESLSPALAKQAEILTFREKVLNARMAATRRAMLLTAAVLTDAGHAATAAAYTDEYNSILGEAK